MAQLAGDFASTISQCVMAEHRALAERWLDRLRALLTVTPEQIFPSPSLLDHIPELISRIGQYLGAPDTEDLAANSAVVLKAQELGALRHAQRASVHQILGEYDLLGGILTTFLREQIDVLDLEPAPEQCIEIINRIQRANSVLRRATIDTFLDRYTDTITSQARQIEGFNRMLSHELRQPVAVVQTAVHLLKANPAARTTEKFDALARNADRVVYITHQLEQIARVGADHDNPATQAIMLTRAATEAARQLRDMSDARGVELRIAPDLPSLITDSARLELVLVNLLSNAIKYSDPGKTDRFVSVQQAEAPAGSVAFAIQDNGLGVPADQVSAIFSQFVRAHSGRDEELAIGGLGLGLSIVRECLDAMGGTIAVESIETAGTTFTITLPLTAGPAARSALSAARVDPANTLRHD